ncbi:unnamed protein product, partial [Haemonchus placei]|uniref:Secreted protein n=1 Tax=Haemonchus placei TaxID=6290 RepID=A0A0N4WF61_HAEPC
VAARGGHDLGSSKCRDRGVVVVDAVVEDDASGGTTRPRQRRRRTRRTGFVASFVRVYVYVCRFTPLPYTHTPVSCCCCCCCFCLWGEDHQRRDRGTALLLGNVFSRKHLEWHRKRRFSSCLREAPSNYGTYLNKTGGF